MGQELAMKDESSIKSSLADTFEIEKNKIAALRAPESVKELFSKADSGTGME